MTPQQLRWIAANIDWRKPNQAIKALLDAADTIESMLLAQQVQDCEAKPLLSLDELEPGELTPWVDGHIKPVQDGLYLREFDEGQAVSEFSNGQWLRDGFFPSDIQDARWCGMKLNKQG